MNRDDLDTAYPRWRTRRLPDFDYANADVAYFVTIRAREGTRPFVDDKLAGEVIASLHWLRDKRGISIFAYCLMPNHLHLVLRLSDGNIKLSSIIGSMKSFSTRRYWELGNEGILWQDRFYDHILRKSEDGPQIVLYIVENPVRAGLVPEAADYPYSGTPDPM